MFQYLFDCSILTSLLNRDIEHSEFELLVDYLRRVKHENIYVRTLLRIEELYKFIKKEYGYLLILKISPFFLADCPRDPCFGVRDIYEFSQFVSTLTKILGERLAIKCIFLLSVACIAILQGNERVRWIISLASRPSQTKIFNRLSYAHAVALVLYLIIL